MIDRKDFVEQFGGVFEHSPWIAERAFDRGRISGPLRSGDAISPAFRIG